MASSSKFQDILENEGLDTVTQNILSTLNAEECLQFLQVSQTSAEAMLRCHPNKVHLGLKILFTKCINVQNVKVCICTL